MHNGHAIDKIIDQLWDYWVLATDSHAFSDDEIIGNIMISAMLYSGLSQKNTLEALLDYLKNPEKIRIIENLNIIFLEPISASYGDLFIDEKTIRKSRNFIPDQITRLWLIHFNTRNIRIVNQSVEYYLELIFNKIKSPFKQQTYKKLRDYANFNWMQLPNVDIDPALSQCLIENISTCGLSETEFERYLHPKFKSQQDFFNDINAEKPSKHVSFFPNHDNEKIVKDIKIVHKDLLQLIRTTQTNRGIDQLIIEYSLENSDKFNEYIKRIVLWLISLYKPTIEQIQSLAERFNFCVTQFQKTFQDNSSLADSSIYTYYSRIAEPWLMHSLQYLERDDDMDTNLTQIYQHIMTNTRLANEVDQSDFKKSKGQTSRMLKRFHHFQQIVFGASDIGLESMTMLNRPRARIIGPATYQAFMNKLDALFVNAAYEDNHHKIFKIIYILAYRTGMRINEILSLRVRDIEGLTDLSIWVQPYGSKKQGNLHQLKTDSAERTIPVYCLLKADEYQLLKQYVVAQRLLNAPNLYLFHLWNESSKLHKHLVTSPFKMIMNTLFKQHDYSFHSFRHTAANQLSVVLNCTYSPFIKNLTDYTEEEYQRIRSELLRHEHGQNHWFIIAHLLGHIDPTETFKSYIHLSYLIAGYKILQYHPKIETQLAKKLMGYNSSFKFSIKDSDDQIFNFEKYSAHLSQQLLNDQTGWLNSNLDDILNEVELNAQPHNYFQYFAGTKESKITFDLFFKCLNSLETHHDVFKMSTEMCLPVELVQYWFENTQQLKQIKNQKNQFRLFDPKKKNMLKPAMLHSAEEKKIIHYFFDNIHKYYEKNPAQIQTVFDTFLSRVNCSHTGISYPWNKIDELESFYGMAKNIFPQKSWQLLGKNLVERLDSNTQPLLRKLAQSNQNNSSTSEDDIVRLQLYSAKNRKALAAFKFCLHLACIGKPITLEIPVHVAR